MSDIQPEVVELIGVLTAVFPNHLDGKGVKTYARLLADIPLPLLKAAVEQCANDCTFFPKPAEIRERANLISNPERLTSADAWATVITALQSGRFYFSRPKFDDPLVQRAVDAMDWEALKSSENPIADRAHFLKLYDQLVVREKTDLKLLPSTLALRAELTEANERRQIQGSTTANAAIQRRGPDRV